MSKELDEALEQVTTSHTFPDPPAVRFYPNEMEYRSIQHPKLSSLVIYDKDGKVCFSCNANLFSVTAADGEIIIKIPRVQ